MNICGELHYGIKPFETPNYAGNTDSLHPLKRTDASSLQVSNLLNKPELGRPLCPSQPRPMMKGQEAGTVSPTATDKYHRSSWNTQNIHIV